MKKKKSLAVLGSTGTMGRKTLQLVASFPELFEIEVLTAFNNADLLIRQALDHRPNTVVIGNTEHFRKVSDALFHHDIKVFAGADSIEQVTEMEGIDMVVNAIAGYDGIAASMAAIKAGKPMALANRDSLVVAGELLIKTAAQKHLPLIPVSPPLSALFQCLAGETHNPVEKVILMAKESPFSGTNLPDSRQFEAFTGKTARQLAVDNATLIQLGWEMIATRSLFGLLPEQVDGAIHPEGLLHAMVQFEDGSLKSQMSLPEEDVHLHYALSYPFRIAYGSRRLSLLDHPALHFRQPETPRFPCFQMAIDAMRAGGNLPCILYISNTIAVEAFLSHRIGYEEIANINHKCMHAIDHVAQPTMNDLAATHKEVISLASTLIKQPV